MFCTQLPCNPAVACKHLIIEIPAVLRPAATALGFRRPARCRTGIRRRRPAGDDIVASANVATAKAIRQSGLVMIVGAIAVIRRR